MLHFHHDVQLSRRMDKLNIDGSDPLRGARDGDTVLWKFADPVRCRVVAQLVGLCGGLMRVVVAVAVVVAAAAAAAAAATAAAAAAAVVVVVVVLLLFFWLLLFCWLDVASCLSSHPASGANVCDGYCWAY